MCMSPSKTSSARDGLHVSWLLAKGVPNTTPKHHRLYIVPCYFDYSSQSDGRSLLLKIQLTYVVEHGAILPVPN